MDPICDRLLQHYEGAGAFIPGALLPRMHWLAGVYGEEKVVAALDELLQRDKRRCPVRNVGSWVESILANGRATAAHAGSSSDREKDEEARVRRLVEGT